MIKKIILVALVISGLLVQGCWNRRELDHLSIVMGTGVDKAGNGQVRFTVQIARSEALGGGSTKGGGQDKPFLVITTQGETVFDAVRNSIAVNSRRLFFSHIQILAVGESLARDGIAPILDFFERDPELRAEMPLVVAEPDAENLLKVPGKLEKTSSFEIHEALEAASRSLGKSHMVRLHDFLLNYNSIAAASFLPVIKIDKEKQEETFKLAGMAVFLRDKMVGRLDQAESRGLFFALGQVKSSIIVIPESNGKISIELLKTQSSVEASMEGGKPVFTVKIKASGNIGEQNSKIDITKPGNIKQVQKLLEEQIEKEILAALFKARRYQADIFGFGEELHRKHPKEWRDMKKQWPEIFQKAKVKVVVKSIIMHSGDKANASQYKHFTEGGGM